MSTIREGKEGEEKCRNERKQVFATEFPQLAFGSFRIGETKAKTLPGLPRPSRLASALCEASQPTALAQKNLEASSQHIISAAKVFFSSRCLELPWQYESIKPMRDGENPYSTLSQYLVTGSITHVDTVPRALSLLKLLKCYGLCGDQIASRVIERLKSLTNVDNVLSIIETVGHNTEVDGISVFEPGESFFLDYALENAADVFVEEGKVGDLVSRLPLIATKILTNLPKAYEAKLPKPPAEDEEDDD